MTTFIISLALATALVGGLYVGLRITRLLQRRLEDMLPQRMVDYCGFVDFGGRSD